MYSLLDDEEFRTFFEKVTESMCTQWNFDEAVSEAIKPIAEKLSIARAEVEYFAPKSLVTPMGEQGSIGIIYSSENWNRDCVLRNEFTIFENGKSVCSFYAKEGYEWTEAERADIMLLSRTLFVTGGNSRLMGLIRKTAVTDSLTGLPNAAAFSSFGEKLVEQDEMVGCTVGTLNIKNIRYLTKKMGSKQSDEIVRKFAVAVSNYMADGEMLARYSGDNFVIIIKNERVDSFIEYLSNISVPLNTGNRIVPLDVAARAGFYEAVEGDEMSEILNAAFVALDVAKTDGASDFVKLDPYMMKRIMREKEISSIFPKALEEMSFLVFFQPKVNLETNMLCGGEALVRWMKDGEIIPPSQFVPVLEREGKISSVDFFVFETVCKSIRGWLDMGIEPVRISVNFSKLNLYNRNLTTEIISIMDKYGVESKYLEIELTEMSGYENYEALCVFIDNMRSLGIKTSIDDFGTGYSSFNLIKDLNADIIKLDRSFLANIDNKLEKRGKTDEIVIKNIVNMVNELDMEVIAEGVETISQAEFLKKINCLNVQGFLFDRPLPTDEFEKILRLKKVYDVAI